MLTPEHRAELRHSLHYSGRPNFSVNRDTLKALLDAADELDRNQQVMRAEQVKRIKAKHLPLRVRGKYYCVEDEMDWPRLSIRALDSDRCPRCGHKTHLTHVVGQFEPQPEFRPNYHFAPTYPTHAEAEADQCDWQARRLLEGQEPLL